MRLITLLPLFLITPAILANDINTPHDPHWCVGICSTMGDGKANEITAQTCFDCLKKPRSELDDENRKCAKQCSHKKDKEYSMWYCNMCFKHGPNPYEWEGEYF